MKKLLIITSVSLLILSSCNKDYNCVCSLYNEQGQTVATEEYNSTQYKKKDKDEAEKSCKDRDVAPNGAFGEMGRKCELR